MGGGYNVITGGQARGRLPRKLYWLDLSQSEFASQLNLLLVVVSFALDNNVRL